MTIPAKPLLLAASLLSCALASPPTTYAQEDPTQALGCTLDMLSYEERLDACALALDEATSDERRSLILSSRAGLFAEQDEFAKARADLGAALAFDPKNADAWIRSASLSLRLGAPIDALAQSTVAAGLTPDDPTVYLYRSLAWGDLDPTSCVEDATRAIELAMAQTDGPDDLPNAVRVLSTGSLARGNCHLAQGAADLAVNDLLATRALDPARDVGASLVDAYLALGDTDAAMAEVDAIAAAGSAVTVDYMRFLVLDASGDRDGALAAIARAHEDAPDNIGIANDYAWTLFLEGDLAEARALVEPFFDDAETIGGITSHIADTFAHILAAGGDTETATSLFGLAVRLSDTRQLEYYATQLERLGFATEGVSRVSVGEAVAECVVTLEENCRLFEE